MGEVLACLSGPACKSPAGNEPYPSTDPLCADCLDAASRDVRALVFDYLDLAQLHETSLSQAIAEKTAGSKEKQMLLVGHVEELQAEIVHVLSTWEYEARVVARLSYPYVSAPVADWHTTISHPTPLAKVRPGAAVQRAVGILAPRMRLLSRLGPTLVCPTGIEDEPVEVEGWAAVIQLAELHSRSRSLLGRTRRTLSLYGVCPKASCRAEALHRQEPQQFGDDPPVWCDACHTQRTYAEYEHFIAHLQWPPHPDDEPEDIEAAA